MKKITIICTKSNRKLTFDIKQFEKLFESEISYVHEKLKLMNLIENDISKLVEDENGRWSQPPLELILEHWNWLSADWPSPRGVIPIYEINNIEI